MATAPTICLAHDGSLNDDWVGRYALRFAHHTGGGMLKVFSVKDGQAGEAALEEKLDHLTRDGAAQGVTVSTHLLPRQSDVAATLLASLPTGANVFLLAGVRVKEQGRGLLKGTVTEQLLEKPPFNVLAVRVSNPGVMGAPGEVLFALSGNPQAPARALPFLNLLGPDLKRLRLLRVLERRGLALRHLTWQKHEALLQGAQQELKTAENFLVKGLASTPALDHNAVVSDDWPKEVLIEANKAKSRLILLGATERSVPVQFLFGNPYEQVLHRAPCDVAIFRGAS